MDAREFDELITRIAQAASRRTAVKGALGGALAGVGVAAAASAKDKGKKGRKGKGKGRGEVASRAARALLRVDRGSVARLALGRPAVAISWRVTPRYRPA